MPVRWYDPTEPSLQQQWTTQRRFEVQRASVTPEYAARVSRMFRANPNMRPGTGLALAKADVDPLGLLAQEVTKREAQRAAQSTAQGIAATPKRQSALSRFFGGAGDLLAKGVDEATDVAGAALSPVYSTIKGVSRGADIGLSSIGQTFQGAFRESVRDGDISGAEWLLGLPHLVEGYKQSDLYAADTHIEERGGYLGLLTGSTDVDYGSGYFAGGEVKRAGVQRRRAAGPLIDGHAATMGRYSAKAVFEPGSTPYSLLSGAVDATVMLASDPTNFVGGGLRKGIEAGRTFSGSAGDVVREVAEDGSVLSRAATDADRVLPDSPAKAQARAFGDRQITAEDFLDSAIQHGSDNPRVLSTVRSLDEGLLSREDAVGSIETMRARIAVESGVVDGLRKTVLSDVANDWLTMNRRGRQFVTWAAQSTNVAQMRRATGGKIDVETLNRLAATRDENEVIDVIGPLLGPVIRERPLIGAADRAAAAGDTGFKVRVKQAKNASRWANMTPHDKANLDDLDDLVEQIDRFGATAKLDLAKRDELINRAAATTNRNERLAVLKDVMRRVQEDELLANGVSKEKASRVTRLWDDVFEDQRRMNAYALDEHGDPLRIPGAPVLRVGDEEIPQASPHLLSEHVGQYVPLPDARELRRATSKVYRTLAKVPGAERPTDAMAAGADALTTVFKQGALLRLAYPVRVIAEEQARMAASGLHSMYVHPLSYWSLMTGRKMSADIFEEPFEAALQHSAAMSAGSAGWLDGAGKVRVPGKRATGRENPNFATYLADNLSEFFSDDLMRRVANGGLLADDIAPGHRPGLDGIKDWFWEGGGKGLRETLRTASSSRGAASKEHIFTTRFDPDDALNSADGYVDSIVERLRVATNGDPRLLEAVATGKVDGIALMEEVGPKRFRPNKAAVRRLQEIVDEGAGPAYVKGDLILEGRERGSSLSRFVGHYDAAMERVFHGLMSVPTNKLSRSLSFRQFYWKRQAELVGYMDPQVQRAALDVARRQGVPKPQLARMKEAAGKRSGTLNAAEADTLSKGFALDSSLRLLYDLHNRNNFFDAMRTVMPFGNAWQEVARTWGRIAIKENPMALRRGQQIVNGLRNLDVDGQDEGFFFTSTNGEEVFAYPFTGWINERVTGVNSQMVGTATGLNVMSSSVVPGLGPVVTIPAAKIIPNRPEYEDVQRLVFPFGEEEFDDGAMGGLFGSLAPGWADKLRRGLEADVEGDRVFANNVAYASRYLLSTGRYDTSSADGIDKLHQDSIKAARWLYITNAVARVGAPSAPTQEFVTRDASGDRVLQARMTEEYQRLLDEDYKTATARFVERFGMDAILNVVSRTQGGASPVEATNDFLKRHPDVARKHREVYGYFLPTEGEFSYEAYKAQLASGGRREITPREAIEIANHRLGQMVVAQYRAQLPDDPTEEQEAWLRSVKEMVKQRYPGYAAMPGNLQEKEKRIDRLVAAADDPVLAETDAGQGLLLYLNYRQQAQEAAEARGVASFKSAERTADLRDWLRGIAEQIAARHPDFGPMFDRTFDQEMVS
jgi:hypothetical protein